MNGADAKVMLDLDRDVRLIDELRARAKAIPTRQGRLNFAANIVVAAGFIAAEDENRPEDVKRPAGMALLTAGTAILEAGK